MSYPENTEALGIRNNITNQPHWTTITAGRTQKANACLFFPRDAHEALTRAFDGDAVMATYYIDDGFWEMLIQSSQESHAESLQVLNVLSDGFVSFSLGPNPIQITITGYLFTTREEDSRSDLQYLYQNAMRGSAQRGLNIPLIYSIKNSVMRLYPLDLSLGVASEGQDRVDFTMTAVASNYRTQSLRQGQGG